MSCVVCEWGECECVCAFVCACVCVTACVSECVGLAGFVKSFGSAEALEEFFFLPED